MSRFFGEDSYFGEGGYLDRQNQGQDRSGTTGPGGTCGDCGGTGDCIHCNGGVYPRRDGTTTLCGKCRGRGNRRHPYLCHACKGKGYGGKRCNTPTYQEMVERREEEDRRASYTKYGKASVDRDTGLAQTNFYMGYVGERNQRKKVHIAIDENGDVVFVRDLDGTVLYDRKNGKGYLPPDLNWGR